MSYRRAALASWSASAEQAVSESPRYFMWWYTAKSLAIVAAVGVAAYYVGKDHGRSAR